MRTSNIEVDKLLARLLRSGQEACNTIGAGTQYPYELLVNVTRLHDTYKLYRVRDFTKVRVELHES